MQGEVEGRDPAVRLHALGTILLVHAVVETWHWVWMLGTPDVEIVVLAVLYSVALAVGMVPRYRRAALWLLTAALAAQCVWIFPFVANHTFLRWIAGLLLAFLDLNALRERRLGRTSIGWLTIVVLLYTGFQKVLYGTYFKGQYLAYLISLSDRFRTALGWLLPSAELERLQSIGTPLPGAGPYTVDSAPFLVLANLVYLAEMGLAAGLLWPRTRRVAVYLTLALILFVEVGARELFFGVLFCNLVLVLHPTHLIRRVLPLSVGLYLGALLWALAGFEGFLT